VTDDPKIEAENSTNRADADARSTFYKEEEEEDYKLWPANKSDCSLQSLSNPAKRHSFVSN